MAEGEVLHVEKLPLKEGEEVQINDVLFAKNEGKFLTGKPVIEGASVTAQVVKQLRAPKLIVYKERQKKVYKKTQGHRQWLTELLIKRISLPKI